MSISTTASQAAQTSKQRKNRCINKMNGLLMNILYIIKENINNVIDINYEEGADNEQSKSEQTQKSAVLCKYPDKNNEQYKFEQIDAVLKNFPDALQDIMNSHVEDGNQIYIALLNYKKYNLTDRHSNPRNININKNINTVGIKNENNIDASSRNNRIGSDIDCLVDSCILLFNIIKTSKAAKFINYDELVELIFLSDKIISW
jgi:hypothetical protein